MLNLSIFNLKHHLSLTSTTVFRFPKSDHMQVLSLSFCCCSMFPVNIIQAAIAAFSWESGAKTNIEPAFLINVSLAVLLTYSFKQSTGCKTAKKGGTFLTKNNLDWAFSKLSLLVQVHINMNTQIFRFIFRPRSQTHLPMTPTLSDVLVVSCFVMLLMLL